LAALSDEELLEQVCGGSEPHFTQLYERYFSRIYGFVYSRVRNHADAEELVQETFTVVFRSARAFSGRSSPVGWIYGIARNTVYNHLRRARTHGERLNQAGPDALQSVDSRCSPDPEQQLSMDRFLGTLGARLRGLSDWQAEVFFLRHVENLPIQEISRRTCRSSNAIRSGLYRVKRVLLASAEAASPPVPLTQARIEP
jgi:RNA polymerase sigma-70 factor (ECF subfamily)